MLAGDRKSVVQGKSVDLGGRRIIKKKKKKEEEEFLKEEIENEQKKCREKGVGQVIQMCRESSITTKRYDTNAIEQQSQSHVSGQESPIVI